MRFVRTGSMRVNEYAGFSYIDYDGQPDPAGDIRAVNADGTKKDVSSEEENMIAGFINAFPDGWRKKFRDDGWRFVYDPSGGEYRGFKDKRGNRCIPVFIPSTRRKRNCVFQSRMR